MFSYFNLLSFINAKFNMIKYEIYSFRSLFQCFIADKIITFKYFSDFYLTFKSTIFITIFIYY
ncbi:hypothetical protein HERIO_2357 [Hepatospora eriocheir]|uniref:Uncharacterized protein n=1 Tax=Hepatospora eriocheir TaxID=1081669 RepID=A0A1X0Q779_9MICR|nr:hypothetical protein HERIO_2357 [Hepatospora eriocheir]